MEKLDVKNRKLLYYLNKNSRFTDTQLSNLLGLSKNAVKYRKEQLIKKGIIRNFSTIINLDLLGYSTLIVLFKFNKEVYSDPEIINYFKDHEFSDWVMILSGGFDLLCEFVVKEIKDFQLIIKECIKILGNKILDYQIFLSEDILRVNPLVLELYEGLRLQPVEQSKRKIGVFKKIDKTDKKILKLITKDSSMSLIDLAKKTNVSVPIVRYRLKKLYDEGIILKYTALINTSTNLGYLRYLCKIKLNMTDLQKIEVLKSFIAKNEKITYAFLDVFTFSLIFTPIVKSIESLDELLRTLKREFGDLIMNQEYYIMKEQIKFDLFPEGLLK